MAITVEDGSGVSSADAWADLAAYKAWEVNFHGAEGSESDALKEAAQRRSVGYLNALPWKGTRTNGRDQSLSWPRSGASDGDGNAIASDEVPRELILAQHAVTWAEVASPGISAPQVNMANGKTLTAVDSMKWTITAGIQDSAAAQRTLIFTALDEIAGFLTRDITDVEDSNEMYLRSVGT